MFGVSSGVYGYIAPGADTVTPFKSQSDIDTAYTNGYNAAKSSITSATYYNTDTSTTTSRTETFNVSISGKTVIGYGMQQCKLYSSNACVTISASLGYSDGILYLYLSGNNAFRIYANYIAMTVYYI